ncbi:bifunctional adenosylcobinamide kinase/adenosylcobinamide-phosphate guanylyltransferase [Eionea flava]
MHLILGGARSGKSQFAEEQALQQAEKNDLTLHYVATATINKDREMTSRVAIHQQRRDDRWTLIEEPLDLASVINRATAQQCLLIDCLTLWLTNALVGECWEPVRDAFFDAVKNTSAHVIFVSNEVGSGIVPLGELSRQFVDESGYLHQRLAAHCEQVSVVIAGLPLPLKPNLFYSD